MLTVQRYDAAHLSAQAFEATPQGGIRARARFTRSGVLEYDLPDGTVRREWRPPDEVFAPESYRTLHDVPITIHHPDEGEVDASTYRREVVGHVSADIAPDNGEYLGGTAVLQDESAVRMAQGGHLKEFSAGYLSLLDPTPGVVPAGMPDAGKPYDVIQRRIRYNHVAFLPPGTGRAGPEVAIRLDSRGNQIGPLTPKDDPMTPEQQALMEKLGLLMPKLEALVAAPAPVAPAAPTVDTAPAPAAPVVAPKQDEAPVPPKTEEEKKTDAKAQAKAKADLEAETERRVNDSIELRDQARSVLGSEYSFAGKSNRQVMHDVVKHVDSKFELGTKSDEYLRARFDAALEHNAERQSLQQHAALRGGFEMHTDSSDAPTNHVDSIQSKIANAWSGK